MAKYKASNLGHSNALRHSGKVKKETPDMKSRRVSGRGSRGRWTRRSLGLLARRRGRVAGPLIPVLIANGVTGLSVGEFS